MLKHLLKTDKKARAEILCPRIKSKLINSLKRLLEKKLLTNTGRHPEGESELLCFIVQLILICLCPFVKGFFIFFYFILLRSIIPARTASSATSRISTVRPLTTAPSEVQ